MNILMVCLGNICRSPLAEGILKKLLADKALTWNVDSAGTSSWHKGNLPDYRSIEIAKSKGIDITDQRSRPLVMEDFVKFDYILAMDQSNLKNIYRLLGNRSTRAKIDLLLEFDPNSAIKEVPDPYYENNFEYVYQLLFKSCNHFLDSVLRCEEEVC
jgi:protein-tyrosine phosphatase